MDDFGLLKDRIVLQRLDATLNVWVDVAGPVWAAIEPQGEDRFRIRIRHRRDLRRKADLAPAMRVKWVDQPHAYGQGGYGEGGYGDTTRYLQIDDVTEIERRQEVHLFSHQVLVEAENLQAGVTEIKVWPST